MVLPASAKVTQLHTTEFYLYVVGKYAFVVCAEVDVKCCVTGTRTGTSITPSRMMYCLANHTR